MLASLTKHTKRFVHWSTEVGTVEAMVAKQNLDAAKAIRLKAALASVIATSSTVRMSRGKADLIKVFSRDLTFVG